MRKTANGSDIDNDTSEDSPLDDRNVTSQDNKYEIPIDYGDVVTNTSREPLSTLCDLEPIPVSWMRKAGRDWRTRIALSVIRSMSFAFGWPVRI
jgi:hypothetical protein